MAPAQERLAADLATLTLRDPDPPLVNNVDARVVRTAEAVRDGLVRQVSGAVRWQQGVEELVRQGVTAFVEVGPGTVLAGLVKKIVREAQVSNVEDAESLQGAAGRA
jgi:[acyl-carrier-protein] S-malonyltransferase